jgi:hypothetical protein
MKYKDGDYKVYSDFLVQDPIKYGNIETEDQSYYYYKQQNDYYDESSEQQKSHYLNPLNSKCPKCTDLESTGYIDLESLIQ